MYKQQRIRYLILAILLAISYSLFVPIVSSQDEPILRSTKVWTTLEQGTNSFFVSNVDIAVTNIYFNSKNKLESVNMVVERKDYLEQSYPIAGRIPYQYLEFIKTGITDSVISNVIIEFRVEKTWINSNAIDPETITLYRYASAWEAQKTERMTKEDDTYYYYQAHGSALSYFLIAGSKKQVEETTIEDVIEEESEPTIEDKQEEIIETKPKSNKWIYFLVFLILGIVIFFAFRKSLFSGKPTKSEIMELNNYVKKAKAQGTSYLKIKNNLLDEGWNENLIDMSLHEVSLPEEQTSNLKKYVAYSLRKGKLKPEIKKELIAVGWQEEIIDEVFKFL